MFFGHEANYIRQKPEKLVVCRENRSIEFHHLNSSILKVVVRRKNDALGPHSYLSPPGGKSLDPEKNRWEYTWILK